MAANKNTVMNGELNLCSWTQTLVNSELNSLKHTENSPKKESASLKLNSRDMGLFGFCPEWDDFCLVQCKFCHKLLRPQGFQSHIEWAHKDEISKVEDNVENSKTDTNCSSSLAQGTLNKNVPVETKSSVSQEINRNNEHNACPSRSGKRKYSESETNNEKRPYVVKKIGPECMRNSDASVTVLMTTQPVLPASSANLVLPTSGSEQNSIVNSAVNVIQETRQQLFSESTKRVVTSVQPSQQQLPAVKTKSNNLLPSGSRLGQNVMINSVSTSVQQSRHISPPFHPTSNNLSSVAGPRSGQNTVVNSAVISVQPSQLRPAPILLTSNYVLSSIGSRLGQNVKLNSSAASVHSSQQQSLTVLPAFCHLLPSSSRSRSGQSVVLNSARTSIHSTQQQCPPVFITSSNVLPSGSRPVQNVTSTSTVTQLQSLPSQLHSSSVTGPGQNVVFNSTVISIQPPQQSLQMHPRRIPNSILSTTSGMQPAQNRLFNSNMPPTEPTNSVFPSKKAI